MSRKKWFTCGKLMKSKAHYFAHTGGGVGAVGVVDVRPRGLQGRLRGVEVPEGAQAVNPLGSGGRRVGYCRNALRGREASGVHVGESAFWS